MLLADKRILVTGVLNDASIAFSVARRAQQEGADVVLTSFGRAMSLTQRAARRLPTEPPIIELDVTAGYRTPAYRITVHITGSADKPNLVFTSDPPLEQADILSVLLFGKPARELGRGQSLALQQQALQIATGYVVPELRTSVMNVLGLDTLEVAFPDRTEAPGQVRVGRYVAQDVLISLGQEFGSRVAQVVGIEYAVGANVSEHPADDTQKAAAMRAASMCWSMGNSASRSL